MIIKISQMNMVYISKYLDTNFKDAFRFDLLSCDTSENRIKIHCYFNLYIYILF